MSTLIILRKNIKWRFHNAFTIVITILQPILWLILYSTIAGQTMQQAGIKNYTAFILPGLIVLVSFAVCSSGGMMNYLMKREGSFYRILIAPVSRSSIILGQLFEAVLCAFLEVGIMAAVSLLFNVRFHANLLGWILIITLIFLAAFFMAGVSYGISLILPNEVVYETVMNAIVLPIFFLSSALFPADSTSGALKLLINLNPFTHIINTTRTVLSGQSITTQQVLFPIILFCILGILVYLFAVRQLNKETDL